MTASNSVGADATPATVTLAISSRLADADSNGLIEIRTLAELSNMRHNLAGTGYQDGPETTPNTTGCPRGGCFGYELMNDLDFDKSGNGKARESDDAGMGQLTLTEDAWDAANLIATFDGATAGPAAMRADPARYELTGIFADPSLADWNSFDGEPDAARVGHASVSTWEIGTLRQAQATGSIRIKGVVITGKYLNFLMAGGGATLDGGMASVGVSIFVTGTNRALATHSPSHCTDRQGDWHWAHIDVSLLHGMLVDIEIHDRDPVSNCGFITFDHLYQSGKGQQAATATRPDMQ